MAVWNQLFQICTALKSVITAIIALETGITTETRIRIWPAPSILAASIRPSGILLNEVRVIIILNTDSAVGRTMAARVSSMPRDRTTM